MADVTVDVLMPYYGDPELLRAAVRSVLAQHDPHWRLTVVDDGSVDLSDWFAGLADKTNGRVRYLRNPHNLGVTGNFNRCLELVEHELVVLMGCDDLLLPDYVGTVRRAHDAAPEAGIIQPGVVLIDGAGNPVWTLVDAAKRWIYAPRKRRHQKHGYQKRGWLMLDGEDLAASLLRGDWLYFPSLCWTSAAITSVRFREDLRVIQDLALLIELVVGGQRLLVDDTVCFQYRRHVDSTSSATALAGSRFTEAERYFLETAESMRAHGWRRAARVARRHLSSRLFALTLLPGALRAPDLAAAGTLARHAFTPSGGLSRSRRRSAGTA
ncbi:MAG TPA: glycosyltransferase family 2 protein [Pseudonocardiaceae bacterium]|jgi:glycosyltransferase involved in cell wall biosynthesis|nr:glycosyltransferase family 2 protein [Pseudonocardiaceae bacterium]